MIRYSKYFLIAFLYIFLSGSGCVKDSKQALFESDSSAVELRSFQSRAFDTTDNKKTLRTVIATMQDLGFVINKADSEVGVVSGSKYANAHSAQLTVTVRTKNDRQLIVRANVQQHLEAVEDPQIYQDFFVSLEKAMFLKAQEVD
jgi:hypothetical protein|tara:strand:- start:3 stop:437 length:435 start_codon:yes stop_codon:yes gene_type:complete